MPARLTDGRGAFLRRVEIWIDKQLCGLMDRLRATGHCHMLEVEFRFTNTEDDLSEVDFTKLLPGFREKGAVTVIDATRGDRVLYSTRNR